MEKVLITGGSGLIGARLTKLLTNKGYNVVHLSRVKNSKCGVKTFEWNLQTGHIESGALKDVDFIIHLAGAGIADKIWTPKRKKIIINSRVDGITLIKNHLIQMNHSPKAFISASGISFYGHENSDHVHVETNPLADCFPARCVNLWETESDSLADICRVVKLRLGVVLSTIGGAVKKMHEPIKYGFGSVLATGQQIVPWVHIDDVASAFLHAIQSSIEGPFNVVAPQTSTNEHLTQAIAQIHQRKIRLPKTPAWVLELMFGELSILLTKGSAVSGSLLVQSGFGYTHTDLKQAIEHIYQHKI